MFSKFSVKKPYTVLVGVVLVLVLGFVSLTRMTADLLPNMSLPYALIITTDPGASPEKIEKTVTAPIEAAMATTSNIKNVSSMSYNNYSVVILEYEQAANMDSVLIEIQTKLDQLKGMFAESVSTPMVMQIDPDMMPVMVASADVDGMDSSQITDYVEHEIIPAIESVEGVASVTATGEMEEHIQVTLNQDKIDALNKKIQSEIEEQFADAQNELDKAQSELESGRQGLENGQNELADKTGEAANQLNNQKLELYKTQEDLKEQLTELKDQKGALETAITGLKEVQTNVDAILTNLTPIDTLLNTYTEDQLIAMGQNPEELRAAKTQMEAALAQIDTALAAQGAALADSGITLNSHTDLPAAVISLETNLAALNTGITQIETALEQIESGKISIDDGLAQLNKSSILASIQMGSSFAQIASGESSLDEAQQTLDSSREDAYEAADLNEILTMDMLEGILTAQNFSMPAGYITENNVQYLVRVGDDIKGIDELSSLVLMDLGMDGIAPVKLSDVADVEMVNNAAEIYAKVNGNPGVMLSIEKQTGYATADVTTRVNDKFDRMMGEDEKLHLAVLSDQGIYIGIIVDSVVENMIFGAILAILILIVFLKDIKPTLVIACSIPLSVIFAVVMMYFTGITLNIISMSGLALGIGMLVDNSIVVIENIYRMRNEGVPARKAAVEGAKQVSGAIAASTLTTICVFAPIIFTEGITRQLFVDMGLTIAFSLLASLAVALTFVPMMAAGVLQRTKEKSHPILEKIQNGYAAFLAKTLRFKAVVLIAVVVLLVVSMFLSFSKGTSFMPAMESTQAAITVTPNGDVEFEELTAMSDEVVERISDIDDIETIGAMAGGGGMMAMMGTGGTDSVSMYLILSEKPELSNQELKAEIEKRTKDMDCEVAVSMDMMDMTAMMGSGIAVQIRGNDMDTLQKIAEDVGNILLGVEGTVDVNNGLDDMIPEFVISVDKEKAAEYKMTVAQVFRLVYEKMAATSPSTVVSTDLKDYEVYVNTQEQEDLTRESLKELTFTYMNKEGGKEEIPLSEIATFEDENTLSVINRESQTRFITVTAGIDEAHNVGLISREIQKQLDKYECPEGYSLEMAGEDEHINDALSQLQLMLVLAVILIYLIMVAQFQSLLSPFIIMFTMPLAFTGGFFALYLTGNEISVVAMIGFIMLAGIIVNNGIVLVDYTNQLRREGLAKKEALIEAGRTRLRPILMTALTTILAMSTMALGIGSGAEMMQPMAIVTIGGLAYGTLLTLIVVPCIYDLFNRNKNMVEEDI